MALKRNLGENPIFIYRRNPHRHNLMTTSKEAEESCDVTVSVGDFKMEINKFVLESVFPHFKRVLSHPLKEATNNVVDVKEMDASTLESL